MKVLHVLDHSLPHYFTGYSFRSDYIIRTQQALGLEPYVVTSPKHEEFTQDCELRAGVPHYRSHWPNFYLLPKPNSVPLLKQAACIAALAQRVERLAAELRVDLIHAHSPASNGIAAQRAARRLGLPTVYEVRYYDEDAAVERGKFAADSLLYRMSRRLEDEALRGADRVVTICAALRGDLIARGVLAQKLFEAPNGVDTSGFQPLAPAANLIARHGLAGKTVLGFIGSFYAYEGLQLLVKAALQLLARRSDIKLLLVGDGEDRARLTALVPAQRRNDVIFTGKVPHDRVRDYYSVMDVLSYPRIRSRLTEFTTPLKPLEAMSMERAVVGSDIGGIRELVRDGETGFLVEPENIEALTERLAQLAAEPALRRRLGAQARTFVLRDRDWSRIVARYSEIYGGLITPRRAAA